MSGDSNMPPHDGSLDTAFASRDLVIALVAASTAWVPLRVIAQEVGISRSWVGQILKAAGVHRPLRQRKEKPPPRVKYTGPCLQCGASDNPSGYTKKRCRNTCYMTWLYKTSEKRRADVAFHTANWVRNNPEQAREIQRRATAAYQARKRAAAAEARP